MASINKLSIRGIRSFSPDDDEQVIEFLFPVTMIVGANGCGKTTIIESLKYAVTGSLPPGKNAGQSFVHDPKSLGQSGVKASIKLRFTNAANNVMVVVRSMELTQKKAKLTFSALDGVLRTTNREGKRVNMSHKCSELDRQIPLLLGVSKPILEHVVFCHQEESSWPLMDSAVLKKRFDDIFDSTRYTKALKNIEEIKKEYKDVVKDLKADVAGLASHKHAAKGFRQELDSQNEELETLEVKIEECRNEVKEADKLIEKHRGIIGQVEELQSDLDERQNEYDREQAVLESKLEYLDEDLSDTHSARQLKDMLRNFDEQAEKRIDAKEELELRRLKLKQEIDNIGKEANEFMSEKGKLESEKHRYEDLLKQRLIKMEEIASKWGIELPVTQSQSASCLTPGDHSVYNSQDSVVNVSDADMKSFLSALQDRDDALKQQLSEHKVDAQTEGDRIQDAYSELSARQRAIEAEKSKLNSQVKESQKEIQNLKSQGTIGRIRQTDIEEAVRSARNCVKERDNANNDPRKSEIPIEIRSYEGKIDSLQRQIDDDQHALRELRLSSDAQNEIRVLKEQVVKEVESLSESLDDQNYDFERFEISKPEFPSTADDKRGEKIILAMESVSSTVTEKLDDAGQNLENVVAEMSMKERAMSEKAALLRHNKQVLSTNRARQEALAGENGSIKVYDRVVTTMRRYAAEAGIITDFDEKDPKTVLSFLDAQLDDLVDMGGDSMTEVVPKVLKRLKKMARVSDSDGNLTEIRCPCCLRNLDVEDVQSFNKNMNELANPTSSAIFAIDPERLQRDRSTKTNFERWKKAVSQGMGDFAEHKRLSVEIQSNDFAVKELESSLVIEEKDLLSLKSRKGDMQSEVDDLRHLSDCAKRWVADAGRIASTIIRIEQKSENLRMSMTAVDANTANRDLRSVERDLDKRREEKETMMGIVSRLNKEMTQINTRVASLSAQASRMEQIAKDKEAKFKEEQASTSLRSELNENIRQWQEDEKKLNEQSASLRPKLRAKELEKSRQRQNAKDEEDRMSVLVNSFAAEVFSIKSIQADIERSVEAQEESNLTLLDDKLTQLERKKAEREKKFAELEPELQKAIRSINDQDTQRKLIQGSIEVMNLRERMKDLKKEMSNLRDNLEQIEGHAVATKEFNIATEKKEQLLDQKARLEGRRGGFVDQIRTLKRKLATSEYKDIEERHRHAMIKQSTTACAVSDLEKYHAALDKALLRFHGIKIGEINKIIRELWTLTYKGQDITNIQIVSGQDAESRATKSYNYRVVMTKGGAQLDMRGRCSAGQRVLASIVIRLALAETFCVNFGCIALDEPTVNLDYNNKRGLAIALSQIIAARAQQSNFQLVIITHDEDFVSMMKTELSSQTGFSMPEKYFQVRREEGTDNRWYSRIDAVDWDELL